MHLCVPLLSRILAFELVDCWSFFSLVQRFAIWFQKSSKKRKHSLFYHSSCDLCSLYWFNLLLSQRALFIYIHIYMPFFFGNRMCNFSIFVPCLFVFYISIFVLFIPDWKLLSLWSRVGKRCFCSEDACWKAQGLLCNQWIQDVDQ